VIIDGLCKSYKSEILRGMHSDTDAYKIALYTSAAELNRETTAYSADGEVESKNGYEAGGKLLTGFSAQLVDGVAIVDFDDAVWEPMVTIKASGALIYNESRGNKSVAVLSFKQPASCINGRFTVEFPAPTKETALIRIM
jgi:hypothetical protein